MIKSSLSNQKNIFILFSFLLITNIASAQFSGGTGSSGDPYQLASVADLQAMDNYGTSWRYYKLTADIDMNGQSFVAIRTNGTQAFQGYIDGDGHVISNLTVPSHGADKVGFVRKLQGTIENLGFTNITVSGSGYNQVGAIAAEIQDNANYYIKNCYVKGGTVIGDDYVGGIAGIFYSLSLIENCFADVTVSGTGWNVGGIAGRTTGAITTCAFYDNVASTINATNDWGYTMANDDSGTGTMTNCYYDKNTYTAKKNNTGTTGLTTAQLTSKSNYTGFDFTTTPYWKIAAGEYAVIDIYDTPFTRGVGSSSDPFQISTVADLQEMDNYGTSWRYYKVIADIDMNGASFVSIRTNNTQAFQGYLDGGGYVISNLTVPNHGADKQGFVRKLQGYIINLGFENLTVNGSGYNRVGGIAAEMQDNANYYIENCYVKGGSITGENYVGGIVGIAYALNKIKDCYADVTVSGTSWNTGGIAGRMTGNITTCAFYDNATSSVVVSGDWTYPIANDNSAGTFTDCYYDIVTFTGSQTNTGATGLNTAQLLVEANYSGFDFATPVWSISVSDGYAILDDTYLLPVELTFFRGKSLGTTNLLEWQTASEKNNAYFEIERSTDGRSFEKIGEVEGNGTTLEISNYQFIDENPSAINYYRLRQVDFDGQFEYSSLITIANKIEHKDISIYPNPFYDYLNIEYTSETTENAIISISDITGRIIQKQNITTVKGNNQLSLDLSNLPKGSFLLHIESKHINTTQIIIK